MNSSSKAVNKKSNGNYFKGVVKELKKVIWPTRSELINYVIVVLVFCFFATLFIWIADFAFRNLIRFLIQVL